jgi:5-methylcytosine-specific restriction protein A
MPVRPPTFRPRGQRTRKQANAEYDARRGSARDRGYDREWDGAALSFRRAHPLCLGCQAMGCVTATEVVDHVEPHKGDMTKFWNRAMWQASCRWHHDVVKQQLEALYAQGKASINDLRLDSKKAIELSLRSWTPGGV